MSWIDVDIVNQILETGSCFCFGLFANQINDLLKKRKRNNMSLNTIKKKGKCNKLPFFFNFKIMYHEFEYYDINI